MCVCVIWYYCTCVFCTTYKRPIQCTLQFCCKKTIAFFCIKLSLPPFVIFSLCSCYWWFSSFCEMLQFFQMLLLCIELSLSFLFVFVTYWMWITIVNLLCMSAVGKNFLQIISILSVSFLLYLIFLIFALHLMCKFLLFVTKERKGNIWDIQREREFCLETTTQNCNCPIIVLCNLMKGEHFC